MFGDVVTVFNYHESTKSWRTTVFHEVDVGESRGANATQRGYTNGDTAILILPVESNKDGISYTHKGFTKRYVKPKEYIKAQKTGRCFTFRPEVDFFIVGDYNSSVPISESDYIDGFYTAMNTEHDGVYLITSAAFYSLIPHFEIGGR